jgi:PAS domain S-box-containing protein
MNNAPITADKTSSTDLLERALCILQDGIIIIGQDKSIVYINESARNLLKAQSGHQPDVGDYFFDNLLEERKALIQQYVEAAFCNHPSKYPLNIPHREQQNWLEVAYFPIPEENSSIRYICIRARDISEKVQLEKKLDAERKTKRNALIKAALDAQERQRAEIGRELHDNVNQVLTTVKLYNEICLSEEKPDRHMMLRSVQQINYCIETLRSLSKDLASPIIAEMGLKESIKELAESVGATRRTEVGFYSYGIRNECISPALQVTIYRIAQEQLTNVLKYAEASIVEVVLVGTSSSIALRIQDDGMGFDLDTKRNGTGITNMISRTEAWDGEIEFKTAPGEGCTLMVEFPLEKECPFPDK